MKRERAKLVEAMVGVAGGQPEAIGALFEVASGPIRGMILSRFQEAGIWLSGERLDDLVRDLVVELIGLAPGWRADGGALPWVWARGRLLALAYARLGVLADDIEGQPSLVADRGNPDDVLAGEPWAPASVVLDRLAAVRPDAALLVKALDTAVSTRDRSVWLEVLAEQAGGNRSPAVTVAQTHDISPDLVRKICQRVRRKVTDLSAGDRRFEPLLELPALAA